MTRSTLWRRAAAVLAVGALAVVGGAGAAQAAPIIDPAATGTLHVHKRVNATGTLTPGNGLENPTAPGTALDGIQFDVQRITNVDLATTAGWESARDLADDPSVIQDADLDAAVSQTTAAGTATSAGCRIRRRTVSRTVVTTFLTVPTTGWASPAATAERCVETPATTAPPATTIRGAAIDLMDSPGREVGRRRGPGTCTGLPEHPEEPNTGSSSTPRPPTLRRRRWRARVGGRAAQPFVG